MSRPVLYPAGSIVPADFTNMGIGILPDAVSCIVTEERNGDYTLSMTYPTNGRHFLEIVPGRVIYAFNGDAPQPFEITFVSRPMGGIVQVEAIHAAQNIAAYIVANNAYTETASAQAALTWLTGVCAGYSAESFPLSLSSNITLGAVTQYGPKERPTRVKDLLYGSEGSALDVYGGEWEWLYDMATLRAFRGKARNVWLTYGKNIADIVQEVNLDGVATVIYPYWTNGETWVYSSASRLVESEHVLEYPYKRIIAVDVTEALGTDSTPSQAQVQAAGEAYIRANHVGVPDVSITVKFIPMHQTSGNEWMKALETVKLCDTVIIDYPPLGINMTAKVIRTEWDVIRERYESVEIGTTVKPSLATAILKYMEKKT